MASDVNLRAIISILDKTAEPLHQISARFSAMTAPLARISRGVAAIAEETGIRNIAEHARAALGRVRDLGAGLASLAGPLAALGAAGSVAGLVEIARSTAEFGESLKLSAPATGLATEELAGWRYAAKLANVDVQQLDRGFQYLNRNIAMAAMGKAKDVEAILSQMGISNTQGHLVATADALKAVAAEAKHLVDSGQVQLADAMMSQLFGQRSGMQLLPLFAQGPGAINAILEAARRHGIALSDAQAQDATKFADSWKNMTAAVDGLRLAIGARLFPVLTPVIERMTSWLDANRAWIATRIDQAVTSFAAALGRVDWEGVWRSLQRIADGAGWVVRVVGGIGPVIAIIAGLKLYPLAREFWRLGAAVADTAARFVVFPVAALVSDFIALIPTIGSASEAFAAFNLVLDANPVGAVILAIGALVAVGYEIYSHWAKIVALWEGLPGPVKAMIETLGAAFAPFIAIPLELYSHWERVVELFREAESLVGRVGRYAGIGGGETSLARLPGGGPAGAPAQQSEAKVTVAFQNLPPGSKIGTETRGAPDLVVAAGYAMVGP